MEDEVPLRKASWQEVYEKIQAEKVSPRSVSLAPVGPSANATMRLHCASYQNQAKKAQPIKDRELHKLGFTVEGQEGDAY